MPIESKTHNPIAEDEKHLNLARERALVQLAIDVIAIARSPASTQYPWGGNKPVKGFGDPQSIGFDV